MIWLDAHLSPRVAAWLRQEKGIDAEPLRNLGLRDSDDEEIFDRAREQNAILITKDRDFADMVGRHGPPPQVIWLRCGNTTESRLKEILNKHLEETLVFLRDGEALVEIQA